jgi:hypothetical protein
MAMATDETAAGGGRLPFVGGEGGGGNLFDSSTDQSRFSVVSLFCHDLFLIRNEMG